MRTWYRVSRRFVLAGMTILGIGGGLVGTIVSANSDYVCSYFQSQCYCSWGGWQSDGTRRCDGTRIE